MVDFGADLIAKFGIDVFVLGVNFATGGCFVVLAAESTSLLAGVLALLVPAFPAVTVDLEFFVLPAGVESLVAEGELRIEFRSRPSVAALAALTAAVIAS